MQNAMRRARENAGLTLQELSELSYVSTSTISNWERGVCVPNVVAATLVCNALGITLDEYIGHTDLR